MKALRSVAAIGILCLASGATRAQANGGAVTPQNTGDSQIQVKNAGDDPVGAGDLVYIFVADAAELTRGYRVSKEGLLSLPLLQEGVPVAGKGPAAIARAVSDALVHDHILVAPIVSAQVIEYRSRQITLAGAVKTPMTIEATGNMKLLDAIARAQGLAPEAGPEIIVSRATEAASAIRVSIKELISGKDSALNIPLHGGEEIRVPAAAKLYIVGNVKTPGVYPMNETGGLSVLEALALSQGTLPFSTKLAYVYRAQAASTERQEIAIPLRDILHRKSPDVQLLPNDVLYIPENSKARLNAAVLEHIVGIASSGAALPILR